MNWRMEKEKGKEREKKEREIVVKICENDDGG